jgi:hypothetical protein
LQAKIEDCNLQVATVVQRHHLQLAAFAATDAGGEPVFDTVVQLAEILQPTSIFAVTCAKVNLSAWFYESLRPMVKPCTPGAY